MRPIQIYMDYRSYLKDWVGERKKEGLPGSNRWFAIKMGINSTSWLTLVLQGKRNLNNSNTDKLIELLQFETFESRYFHTLVKLNQAKERVEQDKFLNRLNQLKKQKNVKIITRDFYEYYSKWYYAVVRAVIGFGDFTGNYEALAERILPPITSAQARTSVGFLEKIGFIKNKDGKYLITEPSLTTGEYGRSNAIKNYQQDTMLLAQQALTKIDKKYRDISTLTIGVSAKNIEKIRDIIAEAQKQISIVADTDEDADLVYQLNVQLFPMTKPVLNRVKYND